MLKRRLRATFIGISAILVSQIGAAYQTAMADDVERLGYRSVRPSHSVAKATEEAIVIVNRVLGGGSDLRFRAGWHEAEEDTDVPVYVVRPHKFGESGIAKVPAGCRCVVLGAAGVEAVLKEPLERQDLMFEYDASGLVSFILLHEAGHIQNGDYGAFVDGFEVNQKALNLASTESKEREDAADAFLIDQLRSAQADTDNFERWWASSEVLLTLNHLSWNLSARRRIDHFGASALGDRRVFFDIGQSHPNFEYRLLKVNHALAQSDISRELLDEFEAARQPDKGPMILYQKDDSGTSDAAQ